MPDFSGLLGQRGDELRMGVAERIDGDAAREIEEAATVGGLQPAALAAGEGERRAGKGVIER
jgi:hypothetical protein